MPNEPFLILAATAAALVFAGLAGFWFRVSAHNASNAAVIENLNTRIHSWWWMVAILASAVVAGRLAVTALFAALSFAALREFLAATEIQADDRRAAISGFFIALPAQYAAIGFGRYDWFAGYLPLLALLTVPVLTLLEGEPQRYLARTAELLWAFAICVYCISYVPALLTLRIDGYEGRQVLLMLFLILVSQTSDIFQYIWGKWIGRHKLAPSISPSKTIEGLIGGGASATALGAALWRITPFSFGEAAGMAFLIVIAGFLGGLVLSAVKRDCGLKDWSHLIPGHGGALDRLDSLCFSAPLFFHLTRIWFAA